MSLQKIKIIDTNFSHATYTSDFQTSKYIEWIRGVKSNPGEIIFMTDNSIYGVDMVIGRRVAMLMEPIEINPGIYDWIKNNYSKFDLVLTYNKELLEISDNILFYPHCMCWIIPEEQKIYPKTKLLSTIASTKTTTYGHRLRHEVISKLRGFNFDLNVYGRGYNPVDNKLTSLQDYAFTIVIENSKSDFYFTEKLIDSFVAGTVPIYWGCPSISNFFNPNGIIIFNTIDDLLFEVKNLSFDKYNSMIPAITENYHTAKKYLLAEDWLFENIEYIRR